MHACVAHFCRYKKLQGHFGGSANYFASVSDGMARRKDYSSVSAIILTHITDSRVVNTGAIYGGQAKRDLYASRGRWGDPRPQIG